MVKLVKFLLFQRQILKQFKALSKTEKEKVLFTTHWFSLKKMVDELIKSQSVSQELYDLKNQEMEKFNQSLPDYNKLSSSELDQFFKRYIQQFRSLNLENTKETIDFLFSEREFKSMIIKGKLSK